MTEKELRKEFYEKFTDNSMNGRRMLTRVTIPNEVFDWFYKQLSEKEELLKAADEVIDLSEQVIDSVDGHDWELDFMAQEKLTVALEKYNSLKKP